MKKILILAALFCSFNCFSQIPKTEFYVGTWKLFRGDTCTVELIDEASIGRVSFWMVGPKLKSFNETKITVFTPNCDTCTWYTMYKRKKYVFKPIK